MIHSAQKSLQIRVAGAFYYRTTWVKAKTNIQMNSTQTHEFSVGEKQKCVQKYGVHTLLCLLPNRYIFICSIKIKSIIYQMDCKYIFGIICAVASSINTRTIVLIHLNVCYRLEYILLIRALVFLLHIPWTCSATQRAINADNSQWNCIIDSGRVRLILVITLFFNLFSWFFARLDITRREKFMNHLYENVPNKSTRRKHSD